MDYADARYQRQVADQLLEIERKKAERRKREQEAAERAAREAAKRQAALPSISKRQHYTPHQLNEAKKLNESPSRKARREPASAGYRVG